MERNRGKHLRWPLALTYATQVHTHLNTHTNTHTIKWKTHYTYTTPNVLTILALCYGTLGCVYCFLWWGWRELPFGLAVHDYEGVRPPVTSPGKEQNSFQPTLSHFHHSFSWNTWVPEPTKIVRYRAHPSPHNTCSSSTRGQGLANKSSNAKYFLFDVQ